MSPEPDDYYVAPDEYSAYVGNRVTADRPDYSKSPSWDAGLTDSDYETLRGLGYGDNDLRALFDEFYRDTAYTPGEDAEDFTPPYTPGEDAKDFIPPYTPGEDAGDFVPPYTPGEDADQFPGGGGKPGATPPGGTTGGAKPGGTGGLSDTFRTAAKALGLTDDKGALNPLMFLGLAGILSQLNKGSGSSAPTGYQGTVPTYTAVRQQIQYPDDPNRRPGSGGRSYFTPVQYTPEAGVSEAQAAATAAADAAARAYKLAEPPKNVLQNLTGGRDELPDAAKKFREEEMIYSRGMGKTEGNITDLMGRVKAANPGLDWSKYNPGKMTMDYDEFDQARDRYLRNMRGGATQTTKMAAQGGLMNLAKGRYLDGSTDGMADKIPATIADKQPARLSHGEFVVPADVVSHLGNGNSNAGAERLYDMMDRIRKARTGNTKQGKQINPNKFLPT